MGFHFSVSIFSVFISFPTVRAYILRGGLDTKGRARSCESYVITYPVTSGNVVHWTNGGGGDSEWVNADNWKANYLPGVYRNNHVIMASGDKATVHCPATYMRADVYLEMRDSASICVEADLNIGKMIVLKTNAFFSQSSNSVVRVGERLSLLASTYEISGGAKLVVGTQVHVAMTSRLEINGDSANVSASSDSQIYGSLTFRLGAGGAGVFAVGEELIVGHSAKLNIDATSYSFASSGTVKIQLIKYTTTTGYFLPSNVHISGLPEGVRSQVKSENYGVYLQLKMGQHSHMPTTSPPTTARPTPTMGPPMSSTSAPTESPTTDSPTTTPNDGSTTTIVLTASGVDGGPRTSMGACPAPDTSALTIDGAAYTAGAKTLVLYQCTNINSGFDPMKIRLINFEPGLWFEMKFSSRKIDLVIKSLDNYKEYWARVRRTYKGEYPFQTSTGHFPDFSWDKVPRWISFRRNPAKGPFTDSDVQSIAANNYLSWYGLGRPEEVIAMARRIKENNPKFKFLLYWNAESYWGSEISTFKPEWLRKGQTGTGGRGLYDHSNPSMRAWWLSHALMMNGNSYVDGVFADNTRLPAGPNNDKARMVKSLADSLPDGSLKMGNFLRQRDDDGNRWRMNYEDGSYFENHHYGPVRQKKPEPTIVSMQMAREASWKRKIVMWNGSRRNCGCATLPQKDVPATCVGFMNVAKEPKEKIEEDLRISLAEYLMIAEEFSYFSFNISPDASCEPWRWDSSSMEVFQKRLGPPRGPPIKVGNTFTRHFDHVSVKIDLETEVATFNWAQ